MEDKNAGVNQDDPQARRCFFGFFLFK